MPHFKPRKYLFVLAALISICWLSVNAGSTFAQSTGPKASPPYKLSVFAKGTGKYSQPDSLVQWRNRIFVGYQNHVAKDGSDHKFSTIVEYSLTGKVLRTFSVQGHNDGLRVVGEDDLWALQNEDANPNLVIIDLPSGRQTEYKFAPTVHGGGFDDIVVKDGRVLLTASNPTLNGAGVNTAPALVSATLHGSMVDVAPVLEGDAAATNIPTSAHVTLNLTDPDSLTVDHRGNVVLNSQADAELIFIRNPFLEGRVVGRLPITLAGTATTVDDTAFASNPHSLLLFSDVGADVVYRLENPSFGFEPGTAYSTSDTAGIVATLDLDTGVLSPVATGFVSTRGAIFVDVDRDTNREE